MLLDLFIAAKWHTVPLKGKLERLAGGKKSLPQFESEWRKKYSEKFNTKVVPLAGVITGKLSNIIAIDCDNQLTYDLFRTLDPDNNFLFVSKGKEQGGGTILYEYTDVVGGFSLVTDQIAMDFYSDEGFIYLPTEDNSTKESWEGVTELPELKPCPSSVLAILQTFKKKVPTNVIDRDKSIKHTISNRLSPMLDNFVKHKKYEPILFKVLTPHSFRDLPSYVTKGHLHPNDVPIGRGSEYLTKISAILGADISVNIEQYTQTMMLINNLWDDPMEKNKLLATVINPMVEGKSNIDGKVIWQYDPHWMDMGFIATALNGDYLESFYDDVKGLYYLINYTIPYIKTYGDKRPLITTLKTLLGRNITEAQYDSTKQLTRTILNPSLEFGHVETTDNFNLFRQTPELSVINNPEPYRGNYTRPNTILKYLETFVPEDSMRAYLLSFIRTKFTTFKYSPVVPYFIGKPGSGKDTFVEILRAILGKDYVTKPDTKVFVEQYNGWMIDKYIIQLDEYGNKLNRHSDKQEVLGKIKTYTGHPEIQIRAMRQDGFNYRHSITFILTANSNPLPVETDDRRFLFLKTPHKLETQEWVKAEGGIAVVHDKIRAEIMDFCFYLATEVKNLHMDAYVIAPMNEDKEKLILESMPAAEQIAFYVGNNKWKELCEVAEEYGVVNFTETWEANKLQDSKLEELYNAMTEGQGQHRVVVKLMKGLGHQRTHTTKMGANAWYYFITDLHTYKTPDPVFKEQFKEKKEINL